MSASLLTAPPVLSNYSLWLTTATDGRVGDRLLNVACAVPRNLLSNFCFANRKELAVSASCKVLYDDAYLSELLTAILPTALAKHGNCVYSRILVAINWLWWRCQQTLIIGGVD